MLRLPFSTLPERLHHKGRAGEPASVLVTLSIRPKSACGRRRDATPISDRSRKLSGCGELVTPQSFCFKRELNWGRGARRETHPSLTRTEGSGGETLKAHERRFPALPAYSARNADSEAPWGAARAQPHSRPLSSPPPLLPHTPAAQPSGARRRAPPLPRPTTTPHLRRVSSELSCLSSERPSALLRSLLSSSAARQCSVCDSPPE